MSPNTIRVLSCPLEPNFHFYNTCTIPCLYNSSKCKYNCIQLGTVQAGENKALSAGEILFYKSDKIESPCIKTINAMKKEAISRIQNIYAFNYYLEFVRNIHFESRLKINAVNLQCSTKSSRIANILQRYPYNISIFKISEADLVLLLTEDFFEEFRRVKKLHVETRYEDILCMSPVKIQKARKVLKKYLKRKGINYEFCKEEDQSTATD